MMLSKSVKPLSLCSLRRAYTRVLKEAIFDVWILIPKGDSKACHKNRSMSWVVIAMVFRQRMPELDFQDYQTDLLRLY